MKPRHPTRAASHPVALLLLAWLFVAPAGRLYAYSLEYQLAVNACSTGVSNQTLVLSDHLLAQSQLNTDNRPVAVSSDWVKMSVFMDSWAKDHYYPVGSFTNFLGNSLWMFSPSEFKGFFMDTNRFSTTLSGTVLTDRVNQLLGLPDTSGNGYIAEIWVDPTTFFRPSRNPLLTNVTESWTFPDPLIGVPGKTGPEYYTWFTNRLDTIYSAATPYPWSSLGYTYDWGTNGHLAGETAYVGLSEFVMFKGAGTYQYYVDGVYTPSQYVPEPGAAMLVVVGVGWLLLARRRRLPNADH
ncbi:MAG: PEP-CTERM sorting domain-containing protein [Verrucomicrobiia bacterium]